MFDGNIYSAYLGESRCFFWRFGQNELLAACRFSNLADSLENSIIKCQSSRIMSRQHRVFDRTSSSGNSKSTFLYFAKVWVWGLFVAFSLILAACGGGGTTPVNEVKFEQLELNDQERSLLADWLETDPDLPINVSAGASYDANGVRFTCPANGEDCSITVSNDGPGQTTASWKGGKPTSAVLRGGEGTDDDTTLNGDEIMYVDLSMLNTIGLAFWLTSSNGMINLSAGEIQTVGGIRFMCPEDGMPCHITVAIDGEDNISATWTGAQPTATAVARTQPTATPTATDSEASIIQQVVDWALEAVMEITYTSDLTAFDAANYLLSRAVNTVDLSPDSTEKTTQEASLDAAVSRMQAIRKSIVARQKHEMALATAQTLNSSSSQMDVDEAKTLLESAFRELAFIPADHLQNIRLMQTDAMRLIRTQEIRLNPSTGRLWHARFFTNSEVPSETVSNIESRQTVIRRDHSTYIMSLYATRSIFSSGNVLTLGVPECDAKVCVIGRGVNDINALTNYRKVPALVNGGITIFDGSKAQTNPGIFFYRFGAWMEDVGFSVEKTDFRQAIDFTGTGGRTNLFATVIGRNANRPTGSGTASWSGLMVGMPYRLNDQHFGKNLVGRAAVDYDFSDNTFDARFFNIIFTTEVALYPVQELNFEDIAVDSSGLFKSPKDLGDEPPGALDRIEGGFFGTNNMAGTFNSSGIVGAFGVKR